LAKVGAIPSPRLRQPRLSSLPALEENAVSRNTTHPMKTENTATPITEINLLDWAHSLLRAGLSNRMSYSKEQWDNAVERWIKSKEDFVSDEHAKKSRPLNPPLRRTRIQIDTFRKDLTSLLNSISIENLSDTPDFILAHFLTDCLEAFNSAINKRDAWNREDKQPAPKSPAPEPPKTVPMNERLAEIALNAWAESNGSADTYNWKGASDGMKKNWTAAAAAVADALAVIHPNKTEPPPITQTVVQPGQVVKTKYGRKYVAGISHPLIEGAEIVAQTPHADGDFSYTCGRDYCKCMQ